MGINWGKSNQIILEWYSKDEICVIHLWLMNLNFNHICAIHYTDAIAIFTWAMEYACHVLLIQWCWSSEINISLPCRGVIQTIHDVPIHIADVKCKHIFIPIMVGTFHLIPHMLYVDLSLLIRSQRHLYSKWNHVTIIRNWDEDMDE